MSNKSKPDALMFISETCPHCPVMLANLTNLLKQGKLASLETLNIKYHTQRARDLNVQSLPWVKIGCFEIEGLCAASELESWANKANTIDGLVEYLALLLNMGKLHKAMQVVENETDGLDALLELLANTESNISIRTGASALLEEFEGSKLLANSTPKLVDMLSSGGANIRADACFFLGLTHNPEAVKFLIPMLKDTDQQVREIANESIEKLKA